MRHFGEPSGKHPPKSTVSNCGESFVGFARWRQSKKHTQKKKRGVSSSQGKGLHIHEISNFFYRNQDAQFHISGAFELWCLTIFVVGHQAANMFLQAHLAMHLAKRRSKFPRIRQDHQMIWAEGWIFCCLESKIAKKDIPSSGCFQK